MSEMDGENGTASEDGHLDRLVEAAALFDSQESFDAAVDTLLTHGFDRAQLSILATDRAVRDRLGHLYAPAEAIEDDPEAPRRAFVAREEWGAAEGGITGALIYVPVAVAGLGVGGLAAALAMGGAAAGGGALGAWLSHRLGQRLAREIESQIEAGGILLWVRPFSEEQQQAALEILQQHGHHAHLHALSR